jgi:hypothetical protein
MTYIITYTNGERGFDHQTAVEWFKFKTMIARRLKAGNKIAPLEYVISFPFDSGWLYRRTERLTRRALITGTKRPKSELGFWVPLAVAEQLERSFRDAPNGRKPRRSIRDSFALFAAAQYGREVKAQLLAEAKAAGNPIKATGANGAEDLAAEESKL